MFDALAIGEADQIQVPAFASKVLDQWAHANGFKLMLTQPGKPTQNAYVESFN